MSSFIQMPRRFAFARAEQSDTEHVFVSKIKIRYTVEKEMEGVWVLMARLPTEADLDRLPGLCAAFGGNIRVEDVSLHEYVLRKEFE